jgi:8-oxo-dGTP pyrophosphatase MutT (NUDIX family)
MRKKKYQAAGGVVIDDGAMLLLDRPSRGEVRLPKGHIEADEDPQTTALREVAEESGYCDLQVLADLGAQVVEFDYEGAHYVRTEHYFLATLASAAQVERGKKDANQFRIVWVPLGQAVTMLTYAAEQEVARKAISAYEAHLAEKPA